MNWMKLAAFLFKGYQAYRGDPEAAREVLTTVKDKVAAIKEDKS